MLTQLSSINFLNFRRNKIPENKNYAVNIPAIRQNSADTFERSINFSGGLNVSHAKKIFGKEQEGLRVICTRHAQQRGRERWNIFDKRHLEEAVRDVMHDGRQEYTRTGNGHVEITLGGKKIVLTKGHKPEEVVVKTVMVKHPGHHNWTPF